MSSTKNIDDIKLCVIRVEQCEKKSFDKFEALAGMEGSTSLLARYTEHRIFLLKNYAPVD